jgi:hypothetical protein
VRGNWKSEGALSGADEKPVLLLAKELLKLLLCGVGGVAPGGPICWLFRLRY